MFYRHLLIRPASNRACCFVETDTRLKLPAESFSPLVPSLHTVLKLVSAVFGLSVV